jgi:uncharacterized membrane protein (UPF0127 family)
MGRRPVTGRTARVERGRGMKQTTYCVYNQTRSCFLSLDVSLANTSLLRLKGLLGKLKIRSDEGLWVVPSRGVHTLGLLFPLDLLYLDGHRRVIHLVESLPPFRIAPLKTQSESVLELPIHTIYSSQTQPGDQLLICLAEEMHGSLHAAGTTHGNHLRKAGTRFE